MALIPLALPHLVMWGLLLIFGIRTYRSCRLESLPWVGIYIVASAGVEVVWSGMGLGDSGSMERELPLQYLGAFISGSAKLAVGLLLLSDLQFVLSKAGVAVEGRFLNRLPKARERSATWGVVMLALLLLKAALGMSLYL